MLKSKRSVLLAGILWTSAFLPALAQGPGNFPPPQPAITVKVTDEDMVVASVNDTKYTWKQLVDTFRTENADAFKQAMAQTLGTKAAETLFGTTPAEQVTLTKADALAAIRNAPPAPIVSYLQVLLRKEVLRQEVAKNNVQVTDAQADEKLNSILKQLRAQGQIQPQMTDAQFLAANHLTREQVKANSILVQLQIAQLIEKDMSKTLGHPVGPDDFFQAQHILVQVTPDPAKPAETEKKFDAAKAKLEKIAIDIKAGKKTFAAEAQDNSDDPGSKVKGGELGPAVRGTMVKEFETTVFTLKPGEISNPVRTQFGYHLIKLEKNGKSLTPAERQEALDRYESSRIQPFMGQIMTRAKVTNVFEPQGPNAPSGAGPIGASSRSK